MMDSAPAARSPRTYRPSGDSRLPQFSSYEEEARFWDTHDFETLEPLSSEDLAERQAVEDEWRSEQPEPSSLRARLTVDLDLAAYEAIVAEARALGVEPAALVRTWLSERLRAG